MIYNQYPYSIYDPTCVDPTYLQQMKEATAAHLIEIPRQAAIDQQRNGGSF